MVYLPQYKNNPHNKASENPRLCYFKNYSISVPLSEEPPNYPQGDTSSPPPNEMVSSVFTSTKSSAF